MAELEWIDWDRVERCVLRLPPDAAYLALRERRGNNEAQIARVTLNHAALERGLRIPTATRGVGAEHLGRNEGAGRNREHPAPSGCQSIPEMAIRWVRMTAEASFGSSEAMRFRLRAYGPKGKQPLESVCFAVHNPDRHSQGGSSREPRGPSLKSPSAASPLGCDDGLSTPEDRVVLATLALRMLEEAQTVFLVTQALLR